MAVADALAEGIMEGYRQLREALFVLATVDNARHNLVTRCEAKAASEAVLPILIALTGRPQQELIDACVNRLQRDGRLPRG